MKKSLLLVTLIVIMFNTASAQNFTRNTYDYVMRDSMLSMDVYKPLSVKNGELNKTILYVFGGGFVTGDKRDEDNVEFFKIMVEKGYNVVAIDYRLGLKGVGKVSVLRPKAPYNAIYIATEDLISATKYIIDNNEKLGVDTSKIVLMGSSAGAITVLRADYELTNRTDMVGKLPEEFRYAGVVSMAGALFTTTGKPKYKREPAPTFMMHGTKDKVVFYKKVQLFNLCVTGTNNLTKIFQKNLFTYWTYRFVGSEHEVATFPREYMTDQIVDFIENLALARKQQQLDVLIYDSYVLEHFKSNVTLKNLYN